MPYGVKTLVVVLAALLVAVARAQDYYEDYLEPQVMTGVQVTNIVESIC